MPDDGKVCTFDCIYCECGYNHDHIPAHQRPTREEVAKALTAVLRQRHADGEPLDDISFAGNGEPTAHPDFPAIISDTMAERDKYFPEAKVSVLSNATMTGNERVRAALMMVDNNIQKVDTVSMDYINTVDRPVNHHYDVAQIVENLRLFHGHVIVQTMFLKGTAAGKDVDNTSDDYVKPWLDALTRIQPQQVMIYTIDRETPEHGLRKAEPAVLNAIKARVEQLGIPCTAAY